jgi:ATP adenylyltransferase
MSPFEMLDRGELWGAVCRRAEVALECGALRPLATRREFVEDGGVRFVVRTLETIERKHEAASEARANPFLPYDEAMFVADVSDTHVALLNKFNVIDHHLLIVTRAFEDQRAPLTLEDFAALWSCMAGFEGLGFYNGGPQAGASQPHKHLQLVPLPLAPGDQAVPVEALLDDAGREPTAIDALPFRHAVARIDSFSRGAVREVAEASRTVYERMCEMLDAADRPYNLLITREWMMLVPRSREHFGSVSVNALGFAGSLFVRNERELRHVKETGPMSVLRGVGEPCAASDRRRYPDDG